MTVQDISSKLFHHFEENDTFSLDDDFSKIVLLPENEEVEKGIVTLSLQDFEKEGLIRAIPEKPNTFVLQKNLKHCGQSVELSYPTILAIVDILDKVGDELKNEFVKANPFSLNEENVQNLIYIINNSLSKDDE